MNNQKNNTRKKERVYLPSARSGRDPQGDGWSEDGGKVFRDAPCPFFYLAVLKNDIDISLSSLNYSRVDIAADARHSDEVVVLHVEEE